MVLRVEIGILECTVIDLSMNFIDEGELVSLQLIAHQDPDDVVLGDKSHDLLRHLGITLNVVSATKWAILVHSAKLVDQFIVSILHWVQVELEGRLLIPIGNIKKLKNMTDIILLVQRLLLEVGERLENAANDGEMLNELLSERLLSELWE